MPHMETTHQELGLALSSLGHKLSLKDNGYELDASESKAFIRAVFA